MLQALNSSETFFEKQEDAQEQWRRQLQKRKGRAPVAVPARIAVEEVPGFSWERKCQQEMVAKGWGSQRGCLHFADGMGLTCVVALAQG